MTPLHPLVRLLASGLLLLAGACQPSWETSLDIVEEPVADDDGAEIEGPDEDGDGIPWPEDCHDGDAQIYPGAEEICDGLDNDCNATTL